MTFRFSTMVGMTDNVSRLCVSAAIWKTDAHLKTKVE